MKIIRYLAAAIAALAGLLLVAVLVAVWLFDPNDYKDYVTDWAEARTGRSFTIDDPLELEIFPWLAVETGGITVGNAEGFGEAPFATVERVAARVRLIPLLSREVDIGTITLEGVELNLAADANGRGNWEDLLSRLEGAGNGAAPVADRPAEAVTDLSAEAVADLPAEVAAGLSSEAVASLPAEATEDLTAEDTADLPAEPAADFPAESSTEPLESFDIEGIRVRDGLVYWRDNVDELRYLVRGLTFDTGSIDMDRTTDIELGFEVLDVDSQLTLGVETQATVTLADWAEDAIARDVTIDFTLRDDSGDERARGEASVERANLSPTGTIALGSGELIARLSDPPFGAGTVDVDAAWQTAELVAQVQALRVERLVTNIAGMEARWQLSGSSVFDAPRLAGSVELAPVPLATMLDLLAATPPDGVDAELLGAIDGRADFTASFEPPQIPNTEPVQFPRLEPGQIANPDTRETANPEPGQIANRDSLQIEFTNLNVNLLGFTATGNVRFDGAEQLNAELAIPAFDTAESLHALLASMLPTTIDAAAFERLAYTGGVDWNRKTGALTLSGFAAEILGAAATGTIAFTPEPDGLAAHGRIGAPPFRPDAFATAFAALLPENIGADELGMLAVDAEFGYDPDADSAIIDPISLGVFGLRGAGRVTATRLSESPTLAGQASLDPFDPGELLRRFDQPVPQTADPTALQSANVATRFEIDATGGQFHGIDLRLDDSRIEGSVIVNDFRNPAYRFTLAADRIDVDRYLPRRASAAAEAVANADGGQRAAEQRAAGQRAAGDIRLSSRALDTLDIDGRVEIGDLTLAGLSFQNVATPIVLGEGRAELRPARADLYGGVFAGGLSVETADEAPSLAVTGQAIGLDLAPLLAARAGASGVSGTGSFDLSLRGRGETVTDNLLSAEGNLSFALRDGTLEGFNLGRSICAAFNTIDGHPAPDDSVPDRTRYELIQGAATVTEGIARSDELLARTAFMDITGSGRLGLAGGQLNYDLESELTGPIGIRGCEPMSELAGGSIPWTLSGTLGDAEIRPDFREYLRQRIEDEAADRLRERVEERLRDLL